MILMKFTLYKDSLKITVRVFSHRFIELWTLKLNESSINPNISLHNSNDQSSMKRSWKNSLKQRKIGGKYFFLISGLLNEALYTTSSYLSNECFILYARRFKLDIIELKQARRSFSVSRHKSPLDRSSGREDRISVRRNVSKPRGKIVRGGYKSVTIKLQSKPVVNLLSVSNRTAVYRS